jgi:hypothetical protein
VESTLLAGGKSKKDEYLGDPARGQADPGSAACLVYHRLPKWPKYDFFNIHEKSVSTKSTNFDIPKNESTGGDCQEGHLSDADYCNFTNI